MTSASPREEDAVASEERLERVLGHAHAVHADLLDYLPTGNPLPGAEDLAQLDELKAELAVGGDRDAGIQAEDPDA